MEDKNMIYKTESYFFKDPWTISEELLEIKLKSSS